MLNRWVLPFRIATKYSPIIKKNGKMSPQIHFCVVSTVAEAKSKNHDYLRLVNVREHSSLSDSRRQKVVLEASSPKLILKKLPETKGSVLPEMETAKNVSFKEKLVVLWNKSDPYVKLMRIDKPIGTWLLFWPCSWSIALASIDGSIPPSVTLHYLAIFLAGSFVMRGAGCTINDLWDRDIDGRVERTKDRPLVSGAITERQAIIFLASQLTVGLALLFQFNWYSILLGASSMFLVVTYPLAKRFTNYPQLFLGATFNWGALIGWSALKGSIEPAVCLPLYAGALCWTIVYDTIYAHQDKLDDARIGIKSTALTFGGHTKPLLSAAGVATLAGLSTAGLSMGLDWPYYAALAAAGAHISWQIYTLDTESPIDCANKFKSNNLVGLIVFLGIIGGGWRQYSKARQEKQDQKDSL